MASLLGLAKLEKKLQRLPDVTRTQIKAAIEASAEDIVRLAKSLVPVRAGELRDSIGWTWGAPPRGSITLAKSAASLLGKDLTVTVFAGDDKAFYARWVEFGTAPHSLAKGADRSSKGKRISGGRQHPGAKSHPFFFPAWRASKKGAKSRIRKATRAAAKKVAAGN
ncbi:HK97-gp10 family putative phage morphogenesis protein [Xanthobacter sp.]|uniref:HK97-gp10 family putative phage morphogenesis protein n=1 Tax=Xanthobacter sp. TaxID=35809 RepID=UPI0025FADE50|nr:HK97-gp10 family putative phage morphogenesis protein [Xanthobacter sp.]